MAGGLIPMFDTKETEWNDLRVDLANSRLIKLTGLKFGSKKLKEFIYAEGGNPHGIGSGNRENTGEIKVLKGALIDMNRAAISLGQKDILDLDFPIVVQFKAKGSRTVQMFRLDGAEFEEWNIELTQGDPKTEVTMPFKFVDFIPL